MSENNLSLREIYRSLEMPGTNPLKNRHVALDKAVMTAYGMKKKDDPLKSLLDLNFDLAKKESEGVKIVGPGLPPCVKNPEKFITDDCVDIVN